MITSVRNVLCAILLTILNGSSPPGSTVCFAAAQGTVYNATTGLFLSCSSGEYLKNSTSCEPCMVGFYCSGSTAVPQQCVNGTYQDQTGQVSCLQCPAGQSCLNPAATPVDCNAGQYSSEGSFKCDPCESGHYSTAKATYCDPCPAGSKCPGGSTTQPCDIGTASSLGDGSCTSCTNGTTTNGATGATYCSECPAGKQCLDPAIAPVACNTGQYSHLGDGECFTCPPGRYCADPALDPVACDVGTYSLGGLDACLDCPAGESCIDLDKPPVNCNVGEYSGLGDANCMPCPAGQACPTTTATPTTCSTSGQFSELGNGTCYDCPSGYICTDPAAAPLKCAIGSTTNGMTGQTTCTACPSGSTCLDPTTAPSVCPDGTYNPSGTFDCEPCPAGTSCVGNTITPCSPGTYSNLGDGVCQGCPAGSVCPYTNQAVLIACLPGSFSLENQTSCTLCDAGFSCPDTTTDTTKVACGLGTYSYSGSDKCMDCSAGMKCPNTDGSGNVACTPGTYSLKLATKCENCPAGKACPYINSDTMITCKDGTFSGPDQTTCTICPAGYACPTFNVADGGATACDPGSYSNSRVATCTDCLPGFACPTIFSPIIIPCQAGTFAIAKQMACTSCPAGEECPVTTSAGTACPSGEYSLGRQTECTPCPAGFDCDTNNAVPPAICAAGMYSPAASTTGCEQCNAGYLCREGSTSPNPADDICPLGSYCTAGTTTATACDAGTYGPTEGLAASGDCLQCPQGYFCLAGTAGLPTVNNLCPRGAYCPISTASSNEHPCPAGTYGPYAGQEALSACRDCPEGRYCQRGCSEPGLPCPRGHYCGLKTGDEGNADSAIEPTPCIAGTYTAEEGARTADACVDCPAGFYCTSGTANPTACDPGTYQPDVKQPTSGSCLDCTAGQACTTAGLKAPDKSCDPGHYCPAKTSLSNANPCPNGTFTDFYNLTSADQCETCPVRFSCPAGTGGTNQAPLKCAPGYYCPNGTQYPTQWPCPAGSYSNKTNLAWLDECWICPKGFWCVNGSTTPQGPCPSGYYCPPGTQYSTQYPCASGSFSNKTGNVRSEDCDSCLQGAFCAEGSSNPMLCPPGTYNNVSSSDGPEDCATCVAGFYCPDNGTADPIGCGRGYYSDYGATVCKICDAGHYCDEDNLPEYSLQDKVCPAGMHCSNGTSQAPNLYNSSCPAGFYCVKGNVNPYPVPCPAKTYSDQTGLKTESECTWCTAGYYCDQTNLTAPAGPCPGGHYCPQGTGSATSNACPASTFLNGTSAISLDSCTECLSGYYCPFDGTSEPEPCPVGHYCIPGRVNAEPCPVGTFSNRTGVKSDLECTLCLGGYYCSGTGNSKVTAPCDAGFYCIEGATNPTPTDGSTGGNCTAGGYCPSGVKWPQPCEPGSFSASEGAKSQADCQPCKPGKFCSGTNAVGVTGDCSPGYYCTGGASTPTQHSVQPGYYAGAGAKEQLECGCGTYSPGNHSSSCDTCPPGQFCNITGMSFSYTCPLGYYCGSGTKTPKACPAGTYNDEMGQVDATACNPCNEGFYCSQSGLPASEAQCEAGYWCGPGSITGTPNGTLSNGGPCPKGSYCEKGESSPLGQQCPEGTFNNVTHGTSSSFCLPCTSGRTCPNRGMSEPSGYCEPGYYCTERATAPYPPDLPSSWGFECEPGYYCPEGSGYPIPCPPGNYTETKLQSTCTECPAGFQCIGIANRTLCPQGMYCPAGTGIVAENCPVGTYYDEVGAEDASFCKPCSAGHYCDIPGLITPTKLCDPSHFCRSGVNVSNPETVPYTGDGGLCPMGYYCEQGTGEPVGCGLGTFSDMIGADMATDCQQCTVGQYCSERNLTAPNGNCSAGFFCSGGSSTSKPTGGVGGDLCSFGKYCPEGTVVELDCPPGGYSNTTGLPLCVPCQAGFYCPGATTDYTSYPCIAGYYCPTGTKTYIDHPCPPGSYGTTDQASSVDMCSPCDPGMYCVGNGTTTPTGPCDPGFYCITNVTSPQPSGMMNVTGVDSCLCPATDTGGRCPIGYFCPGGSKAPEPCTGGYYCETEGLPAPTNQCSAGFYCNTTATRPDPVDGFTGGVCTEGHWCDKGTANPKPCPSGTYNNGTGLKAEADCTKCTGGFYCPDVGQVVVIDVCPEGFFCPLGSSTGTSQPCQAGYHCPAGSPDQVLCESGYYQDQPQAVDCKLCPAGYYCDKNFGPISDYSLYPCPLGSYCPNGTTFATEHLCKAGTYGTKTMRETADECDNCPGGKFCPTEGLVQTDVDTSAYDCGLGYHCISGASVKTPNDSITGNPCNAGYYCPAGDPTPNNCGKGTFNNQTGQGYSAACIDCTPGYYCDSPALENPVAKCSPGFYCPGGDQEPSPVGQNCTVGHFCPEGTANPIRCFDGTYMPDMTAEKCLDCPAGTYCVDGINTLSCPMGFYCPNGTGGYPWPACPPGTLGLAEKLERVEDCTPCPSGRFCAEYNATSDSGACDARFYCRNGSSSATPDGTDGVNGLCSPGHYCPSGITVEQDCLPGTYSNKSGLADSTECYDCPAGKFCSGGKDAPDGDCEGGYYCTGNAVQSKPPSADSTGGPCPSGFECPAGSANPESCKIGTYNNQPGLQECYTCPAGYFCPENATDYAGNICPAGYYCPNGTGGPKDHPCPIGTYNNATHGQDLRDCAPCEPGYYCGTVGLIEPTELCDEGWYCTLCSWSSTPTNASATIVSDTSCLCPVQSDVTSTGGKCQPGSFCPKGSDRPVPCTPGEFCATEGLGNTTSGPCQAGFYCLGGASTSTPTDGVTGDICPIGHYCIAGSKDKTQCPPGMFSNKTENKKQDDCTTCTAGFYCSGGDSVESGPCAERYYCPRGQNVSSPAEYMCPPGSYCPGGMSSPQPCESGTYQDQPGMTSCKLCPYSYFCEAINASGIITGVSVPSECPQGYYCPNGTRFSDEFPCDFGTYGDRPMLSSATECTECDRGSFCGSKGLKQPTGPCQEGFYCIGNSSTATPRDMTSGTPCPVGKFCANGTKTPELCPPGTFGPVEELKSADECTDCTAGQFCQTPGLDQPTGNCTAGYYCPTGSNSSTAFECTVGNYCPEGSPAPQPCPAGSYTDLPQQSICQPCLEGSFCNGTGIEDCPAGYYCPPQTGGVLNQCPRGTYSNETGLKREDQCKACDPGFYCPDLAATGYKGPCDAGYFCRNGSDSWQPSGGNTGDAGICPAGHYCPEGTGEPNACAPGTFNSHPMSNSSSACVACTAGSYCNSSGLAQPSGLCDAGFYCIGSSTESAPAITTPTGGPCPMGSFCEAGSSLPSLCVDGSFAPDVALPACYPCPAGYFCPPGASNTTECPVGHYCVANSTYATPCTNGTYNNATGGQSVDDCHYCDPGYYCPFIGMEKPEGKCASGWYCILGSWMKRPSVVGVNVTGVCGCPADGGIGGQCQPGFYCPEGANAPVPCDAGYYCDTAGLGDVKGPCLQGHYCSGASEKEAPVGETYGSICPEGTYCPTNSSAPTKCQTGFFTNSTGNTGMLDCEICTGGWYCPSPGLDLPLAKCEMGYFCPPGSTEKAPPTNKCPAGTECPIGSINFTPCYSGFYQPDAERGVCLTCPENEYCDFLEATLSGLDGVTTPQSCPAGFYCPSGTEFATQFPCPNGTYSDQTRNGKKGDCYQCDGGWYCDRTNQTAPTAQCYIGHFCPLGSISPTENVCTKGSYCPAGSSQPTKCPMGTYGETMGLGRMEDCSPCDPGLYCDSSGLTGPRGGCTAGFYCSGNSTEPDPRGQSYGDVCPSGAYCPTNSSQPTYCNSGTYNPFPERSQESDCLPCTAGSYCNSTGLSDVTGDCWPGFYCNGSATDPTQHPCSVGHYCPGNSPKPIPCLNGTYANVTGSPICQTCPEGWYCTDGAVDPVTCPTGHYCPMGTGYDWKLCPSGSFNPVNGISSEVECTPCSPGSYCDVAGQPTVGGQCDPGFDCILGVNTPIPNNVTNKGYGGPCPLGHQCPNGIAELCPTGTFANVEGRPTCLTCTSGSYCDGGTINPTTCPAGHYCLSGTTSEFQYACGAGTFNNKTGQSSAASCLQCTGGMYCEGTGNTEPDGECDPGYYCVGGSDSRKPLVTGTATGSTSNDTCSTLFDCVCPTLPDTRGGICPPGYYCPKGSDKAYECTPGMYCPDYEMEIPLLACEAGYYCSNASSTPTQHDCPPGYYCETGLMEPCPPGTYSPTYNNKNITECLTCTAGFYCQGFHNANPTQNCTAGYYCPGGDVTPQFLCPENHYCPEGSKNATVCAAGTHQPSTGRPTCILCSTGRICDPYNGVSLDPENCPQGYYCTPGTLQPEPCPVGKYGDAENYPAAASCLDCPGGMYCSKPGLSGPEDECYGGYYCTGGAKQPDPYMDNSAGSGGGVYTGNSICPIGHYCMNGTSTPKPCPAGTFSPDTGRSYESECLPCPPGKYCDSSGRNNGSTAPDCQKGFYCIGGAVSPTPDDATGHPCPRGHHCPAGSSVPLGCDPGTYSPNVQADTCDVCPPGSVCPYANMTMAAPCDKGFYCMSATSIPTPCPESTYSDQVGATDNSTCQPCAPGSFCNGTGNASPTGDCSAGYFCGGGSSTPTPSDDGSTPYNGQCPVGRFCTSGTTAPMNCPRGTMRNTTGAASLFECFPCDPGFYCLNAGQSAPTKPCERGYYCPGNESNTSPTQYDCPVGHMCPEQSPAPIPCQTGTYQPAIRGYTCDLCPPGFYCEDVLTGGQQQCPPFSYCPAGTPYPLTCPNGTYTLSTDLGLAEPTECHQCPVGKFCTGGQIQGDCSAGYFCSSGSFSPTGTILLDPCPSLQPCAGPCPAGKYCRTGETDPQPCPENTIRTTPGGSQLSDCEFCPAGQWCREGKPLSEPCPVGHYCLGLNFSDCSMGAGPQPCPLYRFANTTGGMNVEDCLPCPAGFWCNETGLSDYSSSACELGFYCTGGGQAPTKCPAGTMRNTVGATSVADCAQCTPGYYCPDPTTTDVTNINGIPCDMGFQCPTGSTSQKPCDSGYYCLEKTGIPDICPGGYYCPEGSYNFTMCLYPFYCPEGTGNPIPCDVGYQPLNISGLRSNLTTACMICPSGSYRNSSTDDKCLPCPAGFYCPEGTGNYQPNVCPVGHYCPVGGTTGQPVPCPAGMYGELAGSVFSVCQPCQAGMYNNLVGQPACFPCGSSAVSGVGAIECTCVGFNRAFQSSDGSCICTSGYIYYNEADLLEYQGNSDLSCEAIVDTRCVSGETRVASDRSCVSAATYSCDGYCGNRGGTMNVDLGTCLCDTVTVPEEIQCYDCNTLSTNLNSDGVLTITTTTTSTGLTSTATVPNVIGPTDKITAPANTYFVQMNPNGAFGTLPNEADTAGSVVNGNMQTEINAIYPAVTARRRRSLFLEDMDDTVSSFFGRRLLQSTSGNASTSAPITVPTNTLPIIANPVICLQLSEMIIFSVFVNPSDRTLSNYPVYVRNHLFNTNPTFDYGAFRSLATYITQTNLTVSNFAHLFINPGIYVFADAQQPGQQVIINVLQSGLLCGANRIQPATTSSLSQLGIAKQSVTNLAPDWVLIAVILALFAVVVLLLLIAVCVWRPRDAGIYPMRYWKPRYRALGEPYVAPEKSVVYGVDAREGLDFVRERGEAEGAEASVVKDRKLLEDFNVRTLYDKLEDQNLHIAAQMHKHRDTLEGFYKRITKKTEGLKAMLNDFDGKKSKPLSGQYNVDGDGTTIVNTTLLMEGVHGAGPEQKEKELLNLLEDLLKKLNSGKITLSDEMINDARRRMQGLDKSSARRNSDDWRSGEDADLIRSQQRDAINLNRELISGERDEISNLIIKHDKRRQDALDEMNRNLSDKLKGDLSKDEINSLLADHEKELEKALGVLSNEKLRQMNELKEQLAAKRRERERKLNEQHSGERRKEGLPDAELSSDEDLSLLQHKLEAAMLDERKAANEEEKNQISASAEDKNLKMSKTLDDELDSMVESGLITDDVREQLKQKIINQEKELEQRMEHKRDLQMKSLRDRMAERKRRRMKKLQGKHDKERLEVGDKDPDLEERQSAEREALEAELDAEEISVERNVIEAIQAEHKESLSQIHKSVISDLSQQENIDEEKQKELLERYQRGVDNYEELNANKRMKQVQDLQARLAARRIRRGAEIQRSEEENMLAKKREEEQRMIREAEERRKEEQRKKDQDDGLIIPEVRLEEGAEVQALVRQQERQKLENEKEKAEEMEHLNGDLAKKEIADEKALERKNAEERDKKKSELKDKHDAEIRARTDLTDEQLQQLMAAHQQELDELERGLEKQQNKQRNALNDRLAARRARKTALLRNKLETDAEKEELERKKEMSQVKAKSAKEAEKVAIIEAIQQNGAESSHKVIQRVLEQRQNQEMKDLEEEFAIKKKLILGECLKDVKDQLRKKMDSMLKRHENELEDLEKKGLSPDQLDLKREELLSRQKDEIRQLEIEHTQECKQIEDNATADWNLGFAKAKYELKEKHYQEYAQTVRELAPNMTQSTQQAEESARRLEMTKQRLEQEKMDAEKKFAQEMLDLEEEGKRRIEMEMEDFEKQIAMETEQEKLKAEKTLKTLEKRKENMLKDKREKMKEEIDRAAAAGASEEEQRKILEQHERDVEKLTNKMDRERLRMQSQLEERLKKRRKEKMQAKKGDMEQQQEATRKEMENKQKAELQEVQEKQIQAMQETTKKIEEDSAKLVDDQPPAPTVLSVQHLKSDMPSAVRPTAPQGQMTGISEKQLQVVLTSSPLYKTLQEIHVVLASQQDIGKDLTTSTSTFTGPDTNSTDTELIPTKLSDLSVHELVAYKFGTFVLGLLKMHRPAHPPVNLLVAEKVPAQPDLKGNAFRGSFCFDQGNGILYIKRSWLVGESVGRLSLLLVHSMAHLVAKDFSDDMAPAFLQEFYQCLAVLSDDLFFARCKDEIGKGDTDASTHSQLNPTCDLLFAKLPVDVTSDRSFHQSAVESRLNKYSHASLGTAVRTELGDVGDKMKKADQSLQGFDRKLEKLAPGTAERPKAKEASSSGELDRLNEEFLSLTKEASDLHGELNRGATKEEGVVRNRLTNVKIRLSEVQKRLRSSK